MYRTYLFSDIVKNINYKIGTLFECVIIFSANKVLTMRGNLGVTGKVVVM